WKPVITKNEAANCGTPHGLCVNLAPSSIKLVHSNAWQPRKMSPPTIVSARNRTAIFGFDARAAATAMAMTALEEISMKVMKVINTMLNTSVCLGHSGLILRMKPYAIKKAANVNASEMIKIHIMNLLHDVPNGDLPPPQSEASILCCSAMVESI